MRTIEVTIAGTTPLLQHRFAEDSEVSVGRATRRVNFKAELPRETAERSAYRDVGGALYFPGAAISRLLREAGSGHKQRGSRRSLRFVVPAAVMVLDDAIPLFEADGGARAKDFEVDARPVTIPATKGRVMRYRPRLDAWAAKFRVRVNEDVLSAEVVHQLLVEGGQQIGIGDFRPERGGPFGMFRIIHWNEEEKADRLGLHEEARFGVAASR